MVGSSQQDSYHSVIVSQERKHVNKKYSLYLSSAFIRQTRRRCIDTQKQYITIIKTDSSPAVHRNRNMGYRQRYNISSTRYQWDHRCCTLLRTPALALALPPAPPGRTSAHSAGRCVPNPDLPAADGRMRRSRRSPHVTARSD